MKRVILQVPEGLTFEMLTQEQQGAINSVFGQFVNQMPGTQPANGLQIVDALTADNFDPATMINYGIDWPILYLVQWGGDSEYLDEIIVPLDREVFAHHIHDGIAIECHKFSGWPDGQFD